jgi:hypothetical protein
MRLNLGIGLTLGTILRNLFGLGDIQVATN